MLGGGEGGNFDGKVGGSVWVVWKHPRENYTSSRGRVFDVNGRGKKTPVLQQQMR